MDVFELFAKLGLDTSEYDKGLESAESTASSFGSTLMTGVGVAAGVTTAAITATTAATIGGTKAFISGVSSLAEYGDNIDKMSQKMNISAQGYQEWDFIMQHCGASITSLKGGMKTLANAVAEGREEFAELGITQEEIASMNTEELFSRTVGALQDVEDGTRRTYLASKLLGRGATELGALFNMTSEETEAMRQQVHDLGGVLSDEAVKDAAQFQDSLQNMRYAFDGMKNSMLSQFLPSFSTVMDGLSLVFSGDTDSGLGMVEAGVNELADNLAKVAPQFIQVGGTILTALATSITENLPVLLESGAEALTQIGAGIITNLPAIIPAAVNVIKTVAGSLMDNFPAILQAGVDILMMLVEGIADNASSIVPAIVGVVHVLVSSLTTPEVLIPLLRGGLEIITGIASGLAESTPELTALIPEIIANLIVTLENVAPDLGSAVLDLLGALGLAILGAVGGLMGMSFDEVSDAFTNLDDFLVVWGGELLMWFSDLFDGKLLGDVGSFFSDLWDSASEGLGDIMDEVGNFGADVIDSFFSTFDDAKNIVSNAIDDLIDFFDFDWSLPQLKLPHFSVSGGEAPWGFAGQGSLPSIKIQWYRKAYDTPMLLNNATIFGASSGSLLGGGEGNGSEMIYGRDNLMRDIAAVVREVVGDMTFTVPVYFGQKKIDQQVVTATARANVVNGGR